jgi:uncharacterized membrane protein
VTQMATGKLIALAFGLFAVLDLTGLFGPGPLVPGLGPLIDPIATIAILALLPLVAAPMLLRLFRKPEPSPKSESGISTPETILRARYVRGELDREQFLLMREDLRN